MIGQAPVFIDTIVYAAIVLFVAIGNDIECRLTLGITDEDIAYLAIYLTHEFLSPLFRY